MGPTSFDMPAEGFSKKASPGFERDGC